jgi:hypothetical protein
MFEELEGYAYMSRTYVALPSHGPICSVLVRLVRRPISTRHKWNLDYESLVRVMR